MSKCQCITLSGKQCTRNATAGSLFCYQHKDKCSKVVVNTTDLPVCAEPPKEEKKKEVKKKEVKKKEVKTNASLLPFIGKVEELILEVNKDMEKEETETEEFQQKLRTAMQQYLDQIGKKLSVETFDWDSIGNPDDAIDNIYDNFASLGDLPEVEDVLEDEDDDEEEPDFQFETSSEEEGVQSSSDEEEEEEEEEEQEDE